MSSPTQPVPAPNVELELAKLANAAIQAGHDPGDVTAKLHATISYLRQYPKMAEHATNALADGVASIQDISRQLAPHVNAVEGAAHAQVTPTPDEEGPSYAQRALGGIASLAHDIPGAEAAQAGARALVRGQPYREALSDIQRGEASAPAPVRILNRLAGGTAAAAALPGSPAMQGARYGILSGLLQSNPDASLGDRETSAVTQGALGGLVGKAGDMALTGARALAAKSPGANLLARKAAMKAADLANYGQAEAEGAAAAGQSTPAQVTAALNAPDIKPYVDVLRSSRTMQGADDPTLLREAYKLMSERQGALGNRIINADDFKAGTSLENADVGAAKKELLTAADRVMPSFRPAVQEHARMAGESKALQSGVDMAGRALRGTPASAKKLATQSPEAFKAAIAKMTPAEAQAALEGALGRTKQGLHLTANPFSGFGVVGSMLNASRAAPVVRALEPQAGGSILADLLRAALAGQGGGINPLGGPTQGQ